MAITFPPAEWPRIATLFDEALALEPPARAAWLADLQAREPGLSTHVARLLGAHARHDTADWLERGPMWAEADLAAALPPRHVPGSVLGRYRLLEAVARGGMGEVWRAEALALAGARTVAIKLPLLHRPDSAAATRFAREGAILASLEHPHIARLYDAGTADDGTPYLAIEWVTGRPLLAWCQEHGLDLRARLRLFVQVLDAVAFAHSRLVLHRDLKPSNILVDDEGRVKLLDFGIAKLLDGDARSEATELTFAAGRVMTAAYAAPEQVRGDTLTPATDVYALGVLLFELLTGERPYRLRFDSAAQLEQAIEAGDLRRPSELVRALRGDLDAIVAKALRHDPAQRYAGAAAFAEDLQRHLDGRPVGAQPDRLSYVAGKFVRRHRTVALAALAGTAALGVGLVMAAVQAVRADHERDLAVASGQRALATQRFLLDLLDDAAKAGKPLTVAELMQRAEALGRTTLADKPDQLAAVLGIVGTDEANARDAQRGKAVLAEALALARDPQLKAQLECTAVAYAGMGTAPDAAMQRLRDVIDQRVSDEATRTGCRLALAQLLIQNGNLEEADRHVEAAWAHIERGGAEAWRERAWAIAMQTYLRSDGRGAGLDERARSTLAMLGALGRDRNTSALSLYNTWGTLAMVSGEPAKAAERYATVVERIEADNPGQPAPTYYLNILASARTAHGALDEAAALLDRSLARAPPGSAALYTALCQRARVAGLMGRRAEADTFYARAVSVPDAGEPLRRNAQPFCEMSRAEALVLAGRAAEAPPLLRTVLEGTFSASVKLSARLVLAEAELALGQAAKARALGAECEREARRLQADNEHSARTGQALVLQALAARELGDADAARRLAAEGRTHLAATTLPQERWHRRAAAWQDSAPVAAATPSR